MMNRFITPFFEFNKKEISLMTFIPTLFIFFLSLFMTFYHKHQIRVIGIIGMICIVLVYLYWTLIIMYYGKVIKEMFLYDDYIEVDVINQNNISFQLSEIEDITTNQKDLSKFILPRSFIKIILKNKKYYLYRPDQELLYQDFKRFRDILKLKEVPFNVSKLYIENMEQEFLYRN